MRIWVDWNGQIVAAVDEDGVLLGHRGSPHGMTVWGELDAIELGSQIGPNGAAILCDNINAVKVVNGKSPRFDAGYIDRGKEVSKQLDEKDQIAVWIPRESNKADGAIRDLVDQWTGGRHGPQ